MLSYGWNSQEENVMRRRVVEAPLRVGICSCTPYYHNQLQGKRLLLESRSAGLATRAFRIKEVLIPDSRQRFMLRTARVHIFVDVHQDIKENFHTTISLNELISNGGLERGWKLFIGGTHPWDFRREFSGFEPISFHRLPAVFLRLLAEIRGFGKLDRWLEIMTPSGWHLPPELRPS